MKKSSDVYPQNTLLLILMLLILLDNVWWLLFLMKQLQMFKHKSCSCSNTTPAHQVAYDRFKEGNDEKIPITRQINQTWKDIMYEINRILKHYWTMV